MLKEHLDGSENATTGDVSMVAGGHTSTTICAGCCQCIEERYYLKAVERYWHLSCLQCYECKLPLHTRLSCYSRLGNIYCKEDYYRFVTDIVDVLLVRKAPASKNLSCNGSQIE